EQLETAGWRVWPLPAGGNLTVRPMPIYRLIPERAWRRAHLKQQFCMRPGRLQMKFANKAKDKAITSGVGGQPECEFSDF
ncbi:MAG: hypothetical protein WAK22_18120, partial [Candidatus Sulfotelmatobacter sp.]